MQLLIKGAPRSEIHDPLVDLVQNRSNTLLQPIELTTSFELLILRHTEVVICLLKKLVQGRLSWHKQLVDEFGPRDLGNPGVSVQSGQQVLFQVNVDPTFCGSHAPLPPLMYVRHEHI